MGLSNLQSLIVVVCEHTSFNDAKKTKHFFLQTQMTFTQLIYLPNACMNLLNCILAGLG